MMVNSATIVIVGGGIAGTTCLETLLQCYDDSTSKFDKIVLISESRLIKKVIDYERRGRNLDSFSISECDIDHLRSQNPSQVELQIIIGSVLRIDPQCKQIIYRSNCDTELCNLSYTILCLCIGSSPINLINLIDPPDAREQISDKLLVIRDTTNVEKLRLKLSECKCVAIIGNGGISLELAAKLKHCRKIWIVRDKFIGCPFLDAAAAKFLLDHSIESKIGNPIPGATDFRTPTTSYISSKIENETPSQSSKAKFGAALGPSWSDEVSFEGYDCNLSQLDVIYDDEVQTFFLNTDDSFKLGIKTKNGLTVNCDLAVIAIGVKPNMIEFCGQTPLEVSQNDGGVLIDHEMRTSFESIYAAGDVVSCEKWKTSNLWFQMRLWTQARQMSYYAARCIDSHLSGEDPKIYFNFDCFTHCTSFFGFKLILLGRFNDHIRKDNEFEIIARVEPNKSYAKIMVDKAGKIIGSILIGDVGLEETIENLILDRLDVSTCKYDLLNDTLDVEDFFD